MAKLNKINEDYKNEKHEIEIGAYTSDALEAFRITRDNMTVVVKIIRTSRCCKGWGPAQYTVGAALFGYGDYTIYMDFCSDSNFAYAANMYYTQLPKTPEGMDNAFINLRDMLIHNDHCERVTERINGNTTNYSQAVHDARKTLSELSDALEKNGLQLAIDQEGDGRIVIVPIDIEFPVFPPPEALLKLPEEAISLQEYADRLPTVYSKNLSFIPGGNRTQLAVTKPVEK
jgi:hypothetical protein